MGKLTISMVIFNSYVSYVSHYQNASKDSNLKTADRRLKLLLNPENFWLLSVKPSLQMAYSQLNHQVHNNRLATSMQLNTGKNILKTSFITFNRETTNKLSTHTHVLYNIENVRDCSEIYPTSGSPSNHAISFHQP